MRLFDILLAFLTGVALTLVCVLALPAQATYHPHESAVTKLTGTATLDFPSMLGGTTTELTITVTGAATGDVVVMGPPAGFESGLKSEGRVTSPNTVTVRLANTLAISTDPASASWKAVVIR